LNQEYKVI